jgi:hypothetical protein
MRVPELNRLLLTTMTRRMMESNILGLPRYSSMNQQALRELRTEAAEPALASS